MLIGKKILKLSHIDDADMALRPVEQRERETVFRPLRVDKVRELIVGPDDVVARAVVDSDHGQGDKGVLRARRRVAERTWSRCARRERSRRSCRGDSTGRSAIRGSTVDARPDAGR